MFRSWVDAYPDLRVEPLELRPNGDRVFVWARFVGHGAASGVAINMERAQVYTVERSKVRRVEEYFDRAAALEATGVGGVGDVAGERGSVREGHRGVQPHGHTGRSSVMDPEVQFEHRLAELEGSYAGLEAVEGFFADVAEHFDALNVHCPDIRDLSDRVLALGTAQITGKRSGVETELPFAVVARFKDGRMTHFTDYGDKNRALEAAGLSE